MNHKSLIKRGLAALLALLIVLTSVPMTNVFAAEDEDTSIEMSVEESDISSSYEEPELIESEEAIELPDETGESSEEEETDPARAGPEESEETTEETEADSVEESGTTPDERHIRAVAEQMRSESMNTESICTRPCFAG